MKFESVEYTVPSHWLSAIINGDETGFDYDGDPKDYKAYKSFCEHEVRDATVEVVGDEGHLLSFHDACDYGVPPCDVHDCIFHYPIKEQSSPEV